MAVRRRVLVSGRVQGVFFREACRRRAEGEGVAGAIRNLPDGRVEASFEGDPDAVRRLVVWCRSGPPSATVEELEEIEEDPIGETGFRVL
ncbi:MAG: acylphosphatase [Actinobacteria bacterium]|nr:acylphosphatase [Actinomycetota bacterium]